MNSIQATTRNSKTKGEINSLRRKGEVPGIIYGGKLENEKISLLKKEVVNLIEKENFLSNVILLKLNGKEQNVLPLAYEVDFYNVRFNSTKKLIIQSKGEEFGNLTTAELNENVSVDLKSVWN